MHAPTGTLVSKCTVSMCLVILTVLFEVRIGCYPLGVLVKVQKPTLLSPQELFQKATMLSGWRLVYCELTVLEKGTESRLNGMAGIQLWKWLV